MKKLKFRYETKYQFSIPISKHFYTLKILPQSNARQKIEINRLIRINDVDETRNYDVYGNEMIIGSIIEPHDSFGFTLEGTAEVNQSIFEQDKHHLTVYKYSTDLTKPTLEIRSWYQEMSERSGLSGWDAREKADYLYHQVYEYMEYAQGVTNVETTAGEVYLTKQGVCQDYTHLLLCLYRMAGLPARYVVGMMIGEGYSHAWVEVMIDGFWIGVDPTNDKYVDDNYIKISQGRDYKDCIICKGHFMGLAVQTQEIVVHVEEVL